MSASRLLYLVGRRSRPFLTVREGVGKKEPQRGELTVREAGMNSAECKSISSICRASLMLHPLDFSSSQYLLRNHLRVGRFLGLMCIIALEVRMLLSAQSRWQLLEGTALVIIGRAGDWFPRKTDPLKAANRENLRR